VPIWISVVNLGEIFYIVKREVNEEEAERSVANILGLGIRVADADWALTARIEAQLSAGGS